MVGACIWILFLLVADNYEGITAYDYGNAYRLNKLRPSMRGQGRPGEVDSSEDSPEESPEPEIEPEPELDTSSDSNEWGGSTTMKPVVSRPIKPPSIPSPYQGSNEECDFQCGPEHRPRCAFHSKAGMLIAAGPCQMEKDLCERGVHDISGVIYKDISVPKLTKGYYRNTEGMHIIRSSKGKGKSRTFGKP